MNMFWGVFIAALFFFGVFVKKIGNALGKHRDSTCFIGNMS